MKTLFTLLLGVILSLQTFSQASYRPSYQIDELFAQAEDLTNYPTDDCERSYLMGMQDAKEFFRQTAWAAIGFGSCLVSACGPAWAGYIGVKAQRPTPVIPDGVDEACYLHGFDMSIMEMRSRNIAIGVTSGMIALTAVYVGLAIAANTCAW